MKDIIRIIRETPLPTLIGEGLAVIALFGMLWVALVAGHVLGLN